MDRAKFYASLRQRNSGVFGTSLSQHQVSMMELLLDEGQKRGVPLRQLAYVLATAYHESGAFKYMRELWGPTAAQKRYEGRKDLGNTVPGDGRKFMGRGFVQITGRANYADWSKRLGIDLLANPQHTEQPSVAARILFEGMEEGTFTGKKLSDYILDGKADYEGARRIVNGTDRKALIAGYAKAFETALRGAGYIGMKPQPSPVSAPQPAPAPVQPKEPEPAPVASPDPAQPKTGVITLIAIAASSIAAYFGWGS